jgi:hypothetical protein
LAAAEAYSRCPPDTIAAMCPYSYICRNLPLEHFASAFIEGVLRFRALFRDRRWSLRR